MLSGHVELARPLVDTDLRAAHPHCIESHALRLPGREVLIFVERDRNRPLVSLCEALKDEPSRLHDAIAQWPMQSHWIERTKGAHGTTLEVQRNCEASCPVYALHKRGSLYLHWDPVELYPHLDGSRLLDQAQCIALLQCRWSYDCATVFKDIFMLPERARLKLDATGMTVLRPPALAAPTPRPLKAGADAAARLCQLVEQATARWPVSGQATCAELSSGLDTTLVVHALARTLAPERLKTFGYVPTNANATLIAARRQETIEQTGAEDYSPALESDLDSIATGSASGRIWPYHPPTLANRNPLASRMKEHGINIVFSGVGGDELCELSESEQAEESASRSFKRNDIDALPFTVLTPDSLGEPPDVPSWPAGLVPQSAHEMANWLSSVYLRNGIWYAHPLALSEIQAFAHFLPAEWRRNRRLSREALRHLGMSEFFIRQEPKESSGQSIGTSLTGPKIMDVVFKDSLLASEGLLDMDKFRQAQAHLSRNPTHDVWGLPVMVAISLELALKSATGCAKAESPAEK